MTNYFLNRNETGLLVIDVQEKLFPHMDHSCETIHGIQKIIKGFRILQLPIAVTEQYPEGLGLTLQGVKNGLDPSQKYWKKTSFSGLGDPQIKADLLKMPINQWVLVGIEAHVCVLQTAKDLLLEGKQVVVVNDAISSRSVYDFSTAIAEMRDCGARIGSVEIVLFELVGDAKAPEFKEISHLVK